jgi:hypothetical protein
MPREASWSAAALCRFGIRCSFGNPHSALASASSIKKYGFSTIYLDSPRKPANSTILLRALHQFHTSPWPHSSHLLIPLCLASLRFITTNSYKPDFWNFSGTWNLDFGTWPTPPSAFFILPSAFPCNVPRRAGDFSSHRPARADSARPTAHL